MAVARTPTTARSEPVRGMMPEPPLVALTAEASNLWKAIEALQEEIRRYVDDEEPAFRYLREQGSIIMHGVRRASQSRGSSSYVQDLKPTQKAFRTYVQELSEMVEQKKKEKRKERQRRVREEAFGKLSSRLIDVRSEHIQSIIQLASRESTRIGEEIKEMESVLVCTYVYMYASIYVSMFYVHVYV